MREWLKDMRTLKKMTQADVAEKAGVSREHCNLIESGKRRPSVDVAKAIAGVLGFDWNKFFPDGSESAS